MLIVVAKVICVVIAELNKVVRVICAYALCIGVYVTILCNVE